MRTLEERFWEKVDIKGDDECWEWKASTRSDGYGQIQKGKRGAGIMPSHRTSWEIHYGKIENNFHVCHRCDNKLCVNPNHLFLGTNADNMADKKKKGLQMRGEGCPSSKLTENDVIKIRELFRQGYSQTKLSKMFGVVQSNISNIISRRGWAWLE